MIEEILQQAYTAGASDVHLTVGVPPMMRVNGKLITMDSPRLLPDDTLAVLISIMSEPQREKFDEQGEYNLSFSVPNCGRCRVNVYRQRGSLAMAFRLVSTRIPSPEELNIPASVIELSQKKRGLVLVTGAAGSGKSTTLAAVIDTINHHREEHVITLEDPIEYLHQHKSSIVNQREIGMDSASYAGALKAALRQDPDVILIGEIQELATMSLALEAAETGHFVLSTLRASGVSNTLERILEFFPAHLYQRIRMQLAHVLEAVVSQQLLPTADGTGRVAAFEVLHTSPEVRHLIREGKFDQLSSVMGASHELGMITMDEAISQLCQEGKIDRDTALQYTQNL